MGISREENAKTAPIPSRTGTNMTLPAQGPQWMTPSNGTAHSSSNFTLLLLSSLQLSQGSDTPLEMWAPQQRNRATKL